MTRDDATRKAIDEHCSDFSFIEKRAAGLDFTLIAEECPRRPKRYIAGVLVNRARTHKGVVIDTQSGAYVWTQDIEHEEFPNFRRAMQAARYESDAMNRRKQ